MAAHGDLLCAVPMTLGQPRRTTYSSIGLSWAAGKFRSVPGAPPVLLLHWLLCLQGWFSHIYSLKILSCKPNTGLKYCKNWKDDLGNCRPVSLTSVPVKVMEQIIWSVITWHVQDNMGSWQVLLDQPHLLLQTSDPPGRWGKGIDAIYLDFSKLLTLSYSVFSWRSWQSTAWTDIIVAE